MKKKRILTILAIVVLFAIVTVGVVSAEDGVLFRRDISKTPDAETEKSAIYMMDFYVPAQASTGLVGPVNNYEYLTTVDNEEASAFLEARDYAKPLITVFIDDTGGEESQPEGMASILGGISFGHFDAYAGVSLDDGTSWRTTNLSRSADQSSFILANGHDYPGDVHNVVHQVAGDRIFVAWVSKYCDLGSPLYKYDPEDVDDGVYFADLEDNYGKDALYLFDLFGVKGNQGSVDYTLQGYPEVGEVPYSCVWTARGKLLAGDNPDTDEAEATYVMWTKPERLTSGARDANLPAVDCAKDAGCILTWQEDPEGLRPGQGLGPGEGWSGAVANGKTDIWYSYISYADFDKVFDLDGIAGTDEALTMDEYALLTDSSVPKPYVPMAMPTRLTDNNMCKGTSNVYSLSDPYCYIDFDTFAADHTTITDFLDKLAPTEYSDYCASQIDWVTPGGSTIPICVAEDGRVMNGRVASTRVRLNLKPYTTAVVNDNGTPDDPTDDFNEKSAWVVMASEETKALGDVLVDPYGNPTEDPIDIGKDVWYYSFDMFAPTRIDQGGMLNQPAICSPWTVGADYDCDPYEFFPVQIATLNAGDDNADNDYEIGEFYLTEIARRFALTTNSVQDAMDSQSGLAAMLIYKQGIINQGGPADIMLRRVILPEGFNPAVDNPYAYENMECSDDGDQNTEDGWKYRELNEDGFGVNPNYLKGLCLSPAINISSATIVECTDGNDNDTCADTFPVADDGSVSEDLASFPKVLEWRQQPYDAYVATGDTFEGDPNDDTDLDDQVWENPFDVAKGHRGFLDGDFVMMMYAWSPNWKANSVGNDHYNLYTRRSFDGGVTWITTPSNWCDANGVCGSGTSATENYCVNTAASECDGTLFEYEAGAAEQAHNVSQLIGNKVTVLDPRYSPTGGTKLIPTIRTDWLDENADLITFESDDVLPYIDDQERDPSIFFMVYETGDNTTVAEGEAVPLDLFYSRATVYGDVWELDPDWTTYDEDGNITEIEDYRWPWLENKADILSGEASMLANPGGTFMYAVWNQWQEEILPDEHEAVFNSDIIYRRLMYIDLLTTGTYMSVDPSPSTSIIYVSNIMPYIEDDVLILGAAWDNDHIDGTPLEDIADYEWTDTYLGITTVLEYDDGNPKRLNIPAGNLHPGWHGIGFKASDKGGRWSPGASVNILVTDGTNVVFLPVAVP
jgi:hypothetical protein